MLNFTEENPDVKVIVTSRRNFYESQGEEFRGTLKGFEEYVLTNITEDDIKNILQKNNINEKFFYKEVIDKKLSFLLKSPFYLNKLIDIYISEKRLPERKILLDEVIEKSFSIDKIKYDTDKFKLKEILEKIAVALEILERNYLTENEFYNLTSSEERKLLKCSSIWQKNIENKWCFIHNNFGEYLASQKLKKFDIEKIKEIVCYKNVENKIKPSWVNTLMFLVNSYSDSKSNKELVNWILKCMPEFFAQLEDEVIDSKTRQSLFWNLFNQFKMNKCWIEYNIYESDNLIINKDDMKKLINEIIVNYHYTTVGNALHIIKNVRRLYGEEDEIKNVLMKLCIDNNYTDYNKSIAIEILAERSLINYNEFLKIVETNNKETSHLRKSYFYCCSTLNIVDEAIGFILEHYNIETREEYTNLDDTEDIYYWNEHKEYELIFSKIKYGETIDEIISFFETNKIYDRESNYNIVLNLLISISRIYSNDDEFIEKCIQLYISYEKDYNDRCMNSILTKIGERKLRLKFFKKYLEIGNNKMLSQYEKIIDDECLDFYIEAYSKGRYSDEQTKYILRFSNKNLINYHKLKNIYEEKTGDLIVNNKAIDYEKIKLESIKYFWNRIFDKNCFIKFIEDFEKDFKKAYNCEEILVKDLFKYKHRMLTEESNKYYYLCSFLSNYLEENEKINIEKINSWDWDYFILGESYKILKNENDCKIEILDEQKRKIEKICMKLLSIVKFRQAIKYLKNNTYNVNMLSIWLHFFRYKFNLVYPKNILLDMLEFDWEIDGEYVGIDYITQNVGRLDINSRIIENLNNKKIRNQIFVNHVKYCLDNDIDSCVDSVGSYLLKKNNSYEEKKIATEYLLKYIKAADFIDKYLEKNNVSVQKELLDYIPKNLKKDFAKWMFNRMSNAKMTEDKMFFAKQLIYIEKMEGISYYYEWAKRNKKIYTSKITYNDINRAISDISAIDMLDILIDFLDLTLSKKFKDNRFDGLYSNLSKAIINIGIQNSDNYIITKTKLIELFRRKYEYEDIGKIQYIIQDMEYGYIKNLQNEESIDSIKKIIE